MGENIPSGFQSFSDRVLQYHSYIVALLSGVVIGLITNYMITYVFPLPYWYGVALCIALLAFSIYVFLLYSPQAIRGNAAEVVPKTLHEFLHHNFDKLLLYIKLDMEGHAFHEKAASSTGWTAPISGVRVNISQVSSHQGDVTLEYQFLGPLKCRILLRIFVTSLTKVKEYRKVIADIEMNVPARLHPRSDQVLRTIGIRLHHAIFNPQIVYPEISDEEYHRILKEIRPSVWEAFVGRPRD